MVSGYTGYANMGSPYEITCQYTIDGNPQSPLKWFKDDIYYNCNSPDCEQTTTVSTGITTVYVEKLFLFGIF